MFTQEQAAQVKQLVIKHTGRFVTEDELQRLYEADYAGYLSVKDELILSYDEYFGNLFEDPYAEECFMDMAEDVLS